MTLVAACVFDEGATIIADSRVTWTYSGGGVACNDRAQKILPVGANLAVAFAGSVKLAQKIIEEIRDSVRKKPRLQKLGTFQQKLSRTARYCYRECLQTGTKADCEVHLLLGAVPSQGKPVIYAFKPPDFTPTLVSKWGVIGSGSVVRPFLEENFERISQGHDPLKDKATSVIIGCESELAKQGTITVGGLFQAILLSSGHIYPLTYAFVDLDPEHFGDAKETSIVKGTWTHRDLVKGKSVSLVKPSAVLGLIPKDDRFHDYKPPQVQEKSLRWYLRHFLTCRQVEKTPIETKFRGVQSKFGAYHYPQTLPILASLSFWGPHGKYPLQFVIEDLSGRRVLHREDAHVEWPYEGPEFERVLLLEINEPGPAFLECRVNDFLLARRALYFGKLEAGESATLMRPPPVSAIAEELVAAHRGCTDRALGSQPCFLDYFVVSQEATLHETEYTFVGEPKAIYSAKYPLHLRLSICSGCRFSSGRHLARIELVNAFTHEGVTLMSGTFKGSSECIVTSAQGTPVVSIPEAGLWYFNLVVDDTLVGSIVLPAETDSPRYSYSLRDEDINRIRSGEVMILTRRGEQANCDLGTGMR